MGKIRKMSDAPGAREAILDAFADIILEGGYERCRVVDVVERSGVARSTFYEHFGSREDLLRESLRSPYEVLASLAASSCDLTRIAKTLEHLTMQRVLIASLIANPGTQTLVEVLAGVIEASGAGVTAIVARAIAGAQLGVIFHWIDDRGTARSASDLAQRLRNITVALKGANS